MHSTNAAGRRRLRAFLVAVVAAVASAPALVLPNAAAAAEPQASKPAITLTAQSSWVQPGGAFRLGLHVDGVTDPGTVEVVLDTYARLTSRSAFAQTTQDRAVGALLDVTSTPLNDLGVDANGNLTATLLFQDPALPREPGRLLLTQDGVYPLRVELREMGGGPVLDHFTTHIPYFPATRTGSKLDLSWIVPVHAPPSIRADGTRKMTSARDLETLSLALEAAPVPLVIAPTPETVQALAASSDSAAVGALASLRRAAAHRQVVTGSYVPTNLPQLIAGGLQGEADLQVQRGDEQLTQLLKVPVDNTTWASEEPLDDASVSRLRDLGITQLALPETSLSPLQSRLTLSRPYLVDAHQGRHSEAVSIDPGLAGHFRNDGNQVLEAHQFLADLAVLYYDQPGGPQRAVVAYTPSGWHPDRIFLDTAMAGLTDNPVIEPVTLSSLFDSADKLRGNSGAPLVRRMVGAPRNISLPIAATRSARQRLNTFKSIVDDDNPVYTVLDEQLLAANSSDLRGSRQRAYITGVGHTLDAELSRIQTPAGSIRLTARGGEIPVTFRNSTGYPVHVVVTMRSDKLEFPGGGGSHPLNEITRRLDLVRRNETDRFAVQTRASGSFPVLVTLQSPDGSLIVSHTQITVRSTAASGVGLLLSAAAGLFLLAWWGRHIAIGRRARRLVPA
ncbi:MAG: hypothetical protein JO085_10340 [Acidimicrobiia bacterium]|nr:hypothetical protein [Acidimicrobiia bacterium]